MKNQNKTWVDSIPKDWSLGRISYKYQVQLGKMLQPEPKGLEDVKKPYLRSANLDWSGVTLDDVKEMWFSPNDLKKYKIEPKDVLVCEGGDVGRTSFWDKSDVVYIQNAINRLRPLNEESNPKFLFYWFSFLKCHGLIDIMCDSSTIAHYTAEKVKATKLVFPTFQEQTLIARFLDQKTSQIDKLIEQKEKLLKLLAEKRTAIITAAVTGKIKVSELGFTGLKDDGIDNHERKSNSSRNPTNPNSDKWEMKDSGIDWLGEIPKGWEVKPIKYLSSKVGDGLHGTPEYSDETEFYFINGNNLRNGVIHITPQTRKISEGQYLTNDKNLTTQTLLLSINGTIGNVAFYNGEKVMLGKSAAYIKFFDYINVQFIRWFLESLSFGNYIELVLTGTTIKNLSLESIKKAPVPFPEEREQERIVEFLEKKVLEFDEIKVNIKYSIKKLKEYREALVTSAITGQIDVREEVEDV